MTEPNNSNTSALPSDGENVLLARIANGVDDLPASVGNASAANQLEQIAAEEAIQAAVETTCEVVEVTLSLDTSIFASGDVLADTQIVTNATRANDAAAVLQSIILVDEDDQKAALDLLFFSGSGTFGTENAAPSISDANARTYLGRISIGTGDYKDLGGVSVVERGGIGLLVKPAAGTRNIYVAAHNGTGTPTYTASGIKLRIGLLW